MKQGILATACGLVLGIVVALVMPLGGEELPTSRPSQESMKTDDDGAAPSDLKDRPGAAGRSAGGNAIGAGESNGALTAGLPDEEHMLAIVQDLVRRRDIALLYKSETELNALSVPGSSVRTADEELLRELGDASIVSLHTEVRGIKMMGADELDGQAIQGVGEHREYVTVEVSTVQEELKVEGQAAVGPLAERCARWLLVPNPWRLDEVLECGA